MRGDNDLCDKAAPNSCQEFVYPVELFSYMVAISEGTVCMNCYR